MSISSQCIFIHETRMWKITLLSFVALSVLALANASVGEKSRKYCRETHVAKSGRVRRIIGGEAAALKEFPHVVALGYVKNGRKEWLCTGSLISDKYVLTGSHCIDMKIPEYVKLGVRNLEADDANAVEAKIGKIIRHPDYNKIGNDIGLIELDTKIEFNDYIRPACLNTENVTSEADSFIATGWGRTESSRTSATLQKVTLNEVLGDVCTKIYNGKVKIFSESHICTNSETKDTCTGDAGAPLQKLNPDFISTYDIYGIFSFGTTKCASGYPSVSTRVSYYIDWIESIVFAN